MAETDWWKGFYAGMWLDVLRQFKTKQQTRAEADLIERALQLRPGSHVLDVPCGAGRLALELASRGYRLTGVDLALPLLETARQNAREGQLEVAWEHRDMRDLPWQEQFDGAFCFGGSFGYFDEEDNAEFLAAVSRALKPGGKFLLEAILTEMLRQEECTWFQAGDIQVAERFRYDHVKGRLAFDWLLVRGGQVEEKSSSIRLYTYRELSQLCKEIGFVDCEGYGSLGGEPFKFGAQNFYLLATKQGNSSIVKDAVQQG